MMSASFIMKNDSSDHIIHLINPTATPTLQYFMDCGD